MSFMKWSEPLLDVHADALSSTPTIKNHSVTHHENYLYCFGGYDGRRNHMTLTMYSILDGRWTSAKHVSGTPPPGRNGHTATLASNDKIIIIGGWLGSGPLAASDAHVLMLSNGPDDLRWYQPVPRGTPPGPCNMHSADYVPSRNEVYVFRGGNGREYLNDLHALDVETYIWRRVEAGGAAPQQRANHSSALLEETNELFIFGGWNGRERLNDIHILNIETSMWSTPHVGGVLPHPRAGMTLTALRDRLFLFGGSGTSSKCFCDLQILDRATLCWLDVYVEEDVDDGVADISVTSRTVIGGRRGSTGELLTPPGRLRLTRGETDARSSVGSMNVDFSEYATQRHTEEGLPIAPASENQASAVHHQDAASDWLTKERASLFTSANPNDEDTSRAITILGRGPGRRAGHTATAVSRFIYVFGGSCGSDYLNDFFVLDTDPPPLARVDEPNSLQLLDRRLRHFFNEEEFSDVTFLVEGKKVYGHRMILSLVSDCFRAMFTTGFRESSKLGSVEIDIPNCSYDSFLTMMEYIYTGSLPRIDIDLDSFIREETANGLVPGSVIGGSISTGISRAVELLELADQFFLYHLKQVCERMLQPAVTAETCDALLLVAQKTNALQLERSCSHFARNQHLQQEGEVVDQAIGAPRAN